MGLSIFADCDMEPDIEAISVPKSCCITASLARRQILAFVGQSEPVEDILTGNEGVIFYLFLHKLLLSGEGKRRNTQCADDAPLRKRSR
jgi:hypothetical protein